MYACTQHAPLCTYLRHCTCLLCLPCTMYYCVCVCVCVHARIPCVWNCVLAGGVRLGRRKEGSVELLVSSRRASENGGARRLIGHYQSWVWESWQCSLFRMYCLLCTQYTIAVIIHNAGRSVYECMYNTKIPGRKRRGDVDNREL